jgi:succinate dehydrogenase flavin-adding protein (antitoxin of CptAB toxin-antitoxin module)
MHLQAFACRACHNLSSTSVQKHDARLDRLLKVPDREIVSLISQNTNMPWKLLAIRAAYIRLGLIGKC